jgi:pimeloyl-ACP methyl ester carboxylesterase
MCTQVRGWISTTCLVVSLSLAGFAVATAQENKAEGKLPEPEDINRDTKDGVALKMTYFAGTLGKKSVPVILLHGWGGQRGDMEPLALQLQALGHTCLTVDLRGHGQSLKAKVIEKNGEAGFKDLDKNDFQKPQMESMALDVETAKNFLKDKNNLGECNIEALGIVACDVSCLVAMRWSIADWSVQNLPAFKLGQDVKALVLLSPVSSYKGYLAPDFFTHPYTRKVISVMLVAGKQEPKSLAEAKRLHSKLQQFHPKPTGDKDLDSKSQDLFLVEPPTKLVGSELLNPALKVDGNIAVFLNLRLVEKQDTYSWSERKNPF